MERFYQFMISIPEKQWHQNFLIICVVISSIIAPAMSVLFPQFKLLCAIVIMVFAFTGTLFVFYRVLCVLRQKK
jgi:hypothetical protein